MKKSLKKFLIKAKMGKASKKKSNTRNEHLLSNETLFGVKEAYKTIRTNLMFSLADKEGCRKIIITSAMQGEGKTSTSVNLAITFAQTGARVLIIDCDLRRPRLHRALNIKKERGVSDVLGGMEEIENVIKRTDEAMGVDCMTSGQVPPNPAELLGSDRMGQLMKSLEKDYDYIFIDSPPVTVVTDAAAMSEFVDGYIIVVRENYTPRELLAEASGRLEFANAKILGFVMTGVKGESSYGGKYKYKYGYRYKYGD